MGAWLAGNWAIILSAGGLLLSGGAAFLRLQFHVTQLRKELDETKVENKELRTELKDLRNNVGGLTTDVRVIQATRTTSPVQEHAEEAEKLRQSEMASQSGRGKKRGS